MLTVTEGAKQHLKKVLTAGTDDPDLGIRLTVDVSGEYGVALDREAPSDHVVEREGSKVLLVEPELVELLQGATLDVQDTDEGPKLVITKEK